MSLVIPPKTFLPSGNSFFALCCSVSSSTWDLYVSGPETGKRKRVTRKADGKLTLLVNLGGVLARKAGAFGYPFQLADFSLPMFRATDMYVTILYYTILDYITTL